MKGRYQLQGGKNWILPKEINANERDKCEPVLLRLSMAGNLENHLCPSMGTNGGRVAMDSEGVTKVLNWKKGMGNTARQVGYLMKI